MHWQCALSLLGGKCACSNACHASQSVRKCTASMFAHGVTGSPQSQHAMSLDPFQDFGPCMLLDFMSTLLTNRGITNVQASHPYLHSYKRVLCSCKLEQLCLSHQAS